MSAKPVNSFEMSEQSLLTLYITFTDPFCVHGPAGLRTPGLRVHPAKCIQFQYYHVFGTNGVTRCSSQGEELS